MRYTFLSKWNVALLTIITFALALWGYVLAFGPISLILGNQTLKLGDQQHPGWSIFALFLALIVYVVAWLIALFDSLQERKWGWTAGLILLVPLWIGPLLYSLFGPRNTR